MKNEYRVIYSPEAVNDISGFKGSFSFCKVDQSEVLRDTNSVR